MKPDDNSDCTFSLKLPQRKTASLSTSNEPVTKAFNILCRAGEMAND